MQIHVFYAIQGGSEIHHGRSLQIIKCCSYIDRITLVVGLPNMVAKQSSLIIQDFSWSSKSLLLTLSP